MKSSLFALFFSLFFAIGSLSASNEEPCGDDPMVHFVITEKKIWIVGDEMPVKNLAVVVTDEFGHVMLEKMFSSKSGERFFLDLSQLPKGKYKVSAGCASTEWEKKN